MMLVHNTMSQSEFSLLKFTHCHKNLKCATITDWIVSRHVTKCHVELMIVYCTTTDYHSFIKLILQNDEHAEHSITDIHTATRVVHE